MDDANCSLVQLTRTLTKRSKCAWVPPSVAAIGRCWATCHRSNIVPPLYFIYLFFIFIFIFSCGVFVTHTAGRAIAKWTADLSSLSIFTLLFHLEIVKCRQRATCQHVAHRHSQPNRLDAIQKSKSNQYDTSPFFLYGLVVRRLSYYSFKFANLLKECRHRKGVTCREFL